MNNLKATLSVLVSACMSIMILVSCSDNSNIKVTPELTKAVQKYIAIQNFHEGLAAVQSKDGKWGYINAKGEEVIPCKYEMYEEDNYVRMNFSNGLAIVTTDGGKYGAIDHKGNIVIPFDYDLLEPFSCERAYYEIHADTNSDSEEDVAVTDCGFLDIKGQKVIHFSEQQYGVKFNEGLCAISHSDGYKFIDINGNPISETIYSNYSIFSEGKAFVKIASVDENESDNLLCIDKNGKMLFSLRNVNDWTIVPFSEGKAFVQSKDNEIWSCINDKGNTLFVMPNNASLRNTNLHEGPKGFQNGYATFEIGSDSVIIIDEHGQIAFNGKVSDSKGVEVKYDKMYWGILPCGLIPIVRNNALGYADIKGILKIVLLYDGVYGDYYESYGETEFSEGLAKVRLGGKWGYVDLGGNDTFSEQEKLIARKKIAEEEQERLESDRRFEEEQKRLEYYRMNPEKCFADLVASGKYYWKNYYKTEHGIKDDKVYEIKRKIKDDEVLIFYPYSETSGTVNFVRFEKNNLYKYYPYESFKDCKYEIQKKKLIVTIKAKEYNFWIEPIGSGDNVQLNSAFGCFMRETREKADLDPFRDWK